MLSDAMLSICTSEYVECLFSSDKIMSKILNISFRIMPITK